MDSITMVGGCMLEAGTQAGFSSSRKGPVDTTCYERYEFRG